jgi:hypothetical protein
MSNIPQNANGQGTMANSEPVVIASDQSAFPVTVSGVSTAAKQDTGNTSVASIDTKTPALGQALAAASVPVILPSATVTTLTPPAAITGFATSAKQDTLLTELQLKADLTETQPVSLASVPSHAVTNAGTFAVQAAESDGANVTLGAKADAKSTATDTTAVTAMQVLKQISASVQAPPSQAVTNAGTFVTQENGAALTSLQLADDVVATLGTTTYTEATTKGTVIGAVRRDANTTLVDTTNEVAPLQVNATGELKVAQIQALPAGSAVIGKVGIDQTTPGTTNLVAIAANQSVNLAQVNGVTTLTGTGATNTGAQRVTVAVDSATVAGSASLPAGTNAIGKLAANSGVDIGDVDVTTVGTITPGTAATSLGKAEDAVHASGDVGVFALGVANAAQTTLAADGDYIAQATDVKGNSLSVGNIAHDGVDAGNPMKTGGRARTSEIAAVASDDRVDFIADVTGKQIVLPYANPENFVSGAITTAMTGTTSTSLVAAPGAGLRNYITTIIVSNTHATVGTDIAIQDGSGGTTLMTIPAAAVYGGAAISLNVPLRQPTANTALFCANVTTGASTKASAVGYKGA